MVTHVCMKRKKDGDGRICGKLFCLGNEVVKRKGVDGARRPSPWDLDTGLGNSRAVRHNSSSEHNMKTVKKLQYLGA